MREIKYQVFDHKLNMMFEVTEVSRLEHSSGYVKGRKGDSGGEYFVTEGYLDKRMGLIDGSQIYRFSLRQSTGLKDKNGVEIYEGDIIDTGQMKWLIEPIGTEERDGGCFGLCASPFGNGEAYFIDKSIYVGSVIGNIYENPELLEVTV